MRERERENEYKYMKSLNINFCARISQAIFQNGLQMFSTNEIYKTLQLRYTDDQHRTNKYRQPVRISCVFVCVCRSVSFPSFYSFDCSYFVCAEITEKIRCVSISIESIFQLKRSIVQKKAHKRKIKHKYFAEREGRVGERESAAMKLVRHCIIIYVVDLTHTRTTKTLGQKSTHTHTHSIMWHLKQQQ